MTEYLWSSSIALSIVIMGITFFKKFLKIVFVIAIVVGVLVFFAQDSFALGLSDFLPGGNDLTEDEPEPAKKKKLKLGFIMIQNEDGGVSIIERKKYIFMTISEENDVVLYDKKTREFDLGVIISDDVIKKIIKELFGKPELFNEIGDAE